MSETASLIRTSAERFLDRHLATPGAPATEAFTTAFVETGLHLVMAPETAGGLAAPVSDAAALVSCWSGRAAPLPIVELVLAGAYAPSGIDSRTLAVGMIPLSETGPDGHVPDVIDAAGWPEATQLLVLGSGRDPVAGLVACDTAEPWRDLCHMVRLRLPRAGQRAIDWSDLPQDVLAPSVTAPLLSVAAMVGVMEHIVAIAIDYAVSRKQFGRPIAKFQAVQTLISNAAAELAMTRAALSEALAKADAGLTRDFDVAVVKAQAGRAAAMIAANAHQAFGAIGFSREHELHHYTKRLWAWRDQWGAQRQMEHRIGQQAGQAGMEGLWQLIVD